MSLSCELAPLRPVCVGKLLHAFQFALTDNVRSSVPIAADVRNTYCDCIKLQVQSVVVFACETGTTLRKASSSFSHPICPAWVATLHAATE